MDEIKYLNIRQLRDSKRQFSTNHLLLAITAIAVSLGLLKAVFVATSDLQLLAASVALALSCGCPIGFLFGGKNGAVVGGAIGIAMMLALILPVV